jgi:hypothetical protein
VAAAAVGPVGVASAAVADWILSTLKSDVGSFQKFF